MRIILIAAKHLAFAKTRLAPHLPASERAALAEAMFRDVFAAALSARSADHVAVVTSDPGLLALARGAGAIAIDEEYPRGLNAAVALATGALAVQGAETVCTVLSDIPLITAGDIDAVFAAMPPEGRGAVLVPSRDFSGTNVIARSPAGVIPTRFGRLSLVKHLDDCRQQGLPCQVLRLSRPALDLDLHSDLVEFVRAASPTRTLSHLTRLGIAHH
ncbi:MAG TPA: 2-phospho-L-lactate guanylyltransferase [Candidatus Binataceae bacterium]